MKSLDGDAVTVCEAGQLGQGALLPRGRFTPDAQLRERYDAATAELLATRDFADSRWRKRKTPEVVEQGELAGA